jgi:hypothetical protein
MNDDPMQVLRVYFVVDVSAMPATPAEAPWRALMQQARSKPLAAAIVGYARASQNFISGSKRALGTGLMKYTLGCFEIDTDNRAAALSALNTQAAARGVSGTATQKFAGVLQAELREAAVDLGYTTTQANKIAVTVVNDPGAFDRMSAINRAQTYLAANDATWHTASE